MSHWSPEQLIRAAQGYYELGMTEDALVELDKLPPDWGQRPVVLEIKLLALMQSHRWEEALMVSRILCQTAPESPSGYIHVAFCLHELGRTPEAKEFLLSGPKILESEPVFYYNMACYDARLGNRDEARAYLEQSIRLDKKFKEFAKEDPDLESLRHE